MPTLKVPLNNFQFGEISPSLTSRTDTPLYNNAAEQVRNLWIRAEGGVKRRAGTEFYYQSINYAKPMSTITFDTAYNIENGHQIQFTLNDGTILTAQFQDASSDHSRVGNTFFFNKGGSDSTTAMNFYQRILGLGLYSSYEAISELSAATSINSNVVSVFREASGGANLDVTTTHLSKLKATPFKIQPIQVRLEPFIFSDDEMYLVELRNANIKVHHLDPITGQILTTITPTGDASFLVNTNDRPYIHEVTYAQQGDVMFLAHPTFMVRLLTRTGLTSFEISTFNFEVSFSEQHIYQPYFAAQANGVRAEVSSGFTAGGNHSSVPNHKAGVMKSILLRTAPSDGNNLYYHFPAPARQYQSGSDLYINQAVKGTVYQITNAGSSTSEDFRKIGAGTRSTTLVFECTSNGSSESFSSTTGRITEVDTTTFVNPIGTNLEVLGSRITITGLQINNADSNGNKAYQAQGTLHTDILKTLPIDSITTNEGSNVITITHALHGFVSTVNLVTTGVTISDAGAVGGISAANINGTRQATIIDDNTYTVVAGSTATSSAIGGGTPKIAQSAPNTPEWVEQSYSPVYGYPSAITFHQNRLWFAGTLGQPDGIWASKSGKYFNFDIGDGEDNDALDLTSNVGEINQILHLVSNRDLQVFTAGSELYVRASNNAAITPSNAQILKQTPFGSDFVRPAPFDGATLFMQNTGTALREFLFTDAENAYTSVAVSALAPHLIRNPVQQTVIKGSLDRSENYSFLLNSDGTIAVFYSVRGDKKAGWSLWDTQGTWASICSVRNHLYAVAVRDRGDGTLRHSIEKFESSLPLDYSTIRSAESTAGLFTNLITTQSSSKNGVAYTIPIQFAVGATVNAINVNDHLGQFTVASANSGSIDASSAKTNVRDGILGFPFYSTIKTLPVDAQLANGPLTGEPREISRVIVDFNTTLSANIKAPTTLSTARDLIVSAQTSEPQPQKIPFTGKKEFRTLGYDKDPRVIVSQTVPLDLQINGMIVEVAY